jgi:hypothetical protein
MSIPSLWSPVSPPAADAVTESTIAIEACRRAGPFVSPGASRLLLLLPVMFLPLVRGLARTLCSLAVRGGLLTSVMPLLLLLLFLLPPALIDSPAGEGGLAEFPVPAGLPRWGAERDDGGDPNSPPFWLAVAPMRRRSRAACRILVFSETIGELGGCGALGIFFVIGVAGVPTLFVGEEAATIEAAWRCNRLIRF